MGVGAGRVEGRESHHIVGSRRQSGTNSGSVYGIVNVIASPSRNDPSELLVVVRGLGESVVASGSGGEPPVDCNSVVVLNCGAIPILLDQRLPSSVVRGDSVPQALQHQAGNHQIANRTSRLGDYQRRSELITR